MKYLLVLCLIFTGFAGFSFAEVKTSLQSDTKALTERDEEISSNIYQEHSTYIINCSFFDYAALKTRPQRAQAIAINFDTSTDISAVQSAKHTTVYSSPLYLPLIRLLLYPKHYFW